MEKIKLTDGTEIQIEYGATLQEVFVIVESFSDLKPIADALTKDGNLDKLEFVNEEDISGEYEDMKLVAPLFKNIDKMEDGKIMASFGFREKTEIEKAIEELQESQENQNKAIDELADVVSDIVEVE